MQRSNVGPWRFRLVSTIALSAAFGVALGVLGSRSLAQVTALTEHKGLQVEALGVVSEDSMEKQIGLTGYKLQLREITIVPAS